jgi:thiol-disulfide isomerase/thioredoxin
MMRKSKLSLIILFFVFLFLIQSVAAEGLVVVNFYYSESCGSCDAFKPIIRQIEDDERYAGKIVVNWKEVGSNDTNRQEWRDFGFYGYPSAVVYIDKDNAAKLPKDNLTYIEMSNIIDAFLSEGIHNQTYDSNILQFDMPFVGRVTINLTGLSLPVLTVLLGAVDSANPCSIFILFILLSLLIHSHSRKRMLLVGGIFIFFSGLWYFIFMFVLLRTIGALEAGILSIVIGSIAIIFGIFNIKDFFFPKKGASLSIPEDKKPGLFKQMRDIVKNPSVFAAIGGTIFLAVTVNLFELLCSLQWPLYYIARLSMYDLPEMQNYMYMVFYNVVYVIPLIVILLLFVFSIGRMKISEWQGQKLKLFSGIMIFSFGLLFLIDYKILENVLTPIVLLIFSIIFTFVISYIWKKYEEDEDKPKIPLTKDDKEKSKEKKSSPKKKSKNKKK